MSLTLVECSTDNCYTTLITTSTGCVHKSAVHYSDTYIIHTSLETFHFMQNICNCINCLNTAKPGRDISQRPETPNTFCSCAYVQLKTL